MSNSIYIPFNFNPISTTVKTSAYTIPTGRFARAIVSFREKKSYIGVAQSFYPTSDTITVNGVEVLRNKYFYYDLGSTTYLYGVPACDLLHFATSASDGSDGNYYTINGARAFRAGTGVNTYYLRCSFYGTCGTNTNSTLFGHGNVQTLPDQIELWLKAGDVINGSGSWQAILTEFNEAI